jgi:M3 family oligoendopeptidase
MEERDLLDLNTKENKAPMGYCTYISQYKAPFIFSNFNGTSDDIDVLTHEAGHAFQVFMSRHLEQIDYKWPTADAAEIHSMSMEFFTWPWMDSFFGADADKYKFGHLSRSLSFLPYGVLVDEFQHGIYENPNMSISERNTLWRSLEEKYLPHRTYQDSTFLQEGRFWQRQNHIFGMPFYYIDYALAQICALQFGVRDQKDHNEAWEDYLKICKIGGSRSFLDIVKLGGLMNPFEDGCVETVAESAINWLNSIDDSKF